MTFAVTPVGHVRGGRRDPAETDRWGAVVSEVVIQERFGDEALTGLADFSHVEVVFLFDQVQERADYRGRRPCTSQTGPPS